MLLADAPRIRIRDGYLGAGPVRDIDISGNAYLRCCSMHRMCLMSMRLPATVALYGVDSNDRPGDPRRAEDSV